MMAVAELATAVQVGLNVVVLIVNNGMYGTIRAHQERNFPSRTIGTDLRNPDFPALAASFGAHGERVTTDAQFAPALERALAAGKPAVIDLQLNQEAISARASLSDLRSTTQAQGNSKHG
jgi:acetolactate synthase-1/2/3 large subunit